MDSGCILFWWIPQNILVSIPECLNFGGMSNCRNGNISRTPCQFAFLWNPPESPESGRNQWGITNTFFSWCMIAHDNDFIHPDARVIFSPSIGCCWWACKLSNSGLSVIENKSTSTVAREISGPNVWFTNLLKMWKDISASGKGGLALKLPRAAWVSQKTVKISKTQSALGSHRSKSTWNSIFKDSQSNFKALPKTPRYTQSSPRASQSDLKAS